MLMELWVELHWNYANLCYLTTWPCSLPMNILERVVWMNIPASYLTGPDLQLMQNDVALLKSVELYGFPLAEDLAHSLEYSWTLNTTGQKCS